MNPIILGLLVKNQFLDNQIFYHHIILICTSTLFHKILNMELHFFLNMPLYYYKHALKVMAIKIYHL